MDYKPQKYPQFYSDIQKIKNRKSKRKKKEIEESDIRFFNCPMDIIYRIIDDGIIDMRKHKDLNTKTVALSMVFDYDLSKIKGRDRKQHIKIISIIEEFNKAVEMLDREAEDYHDNMMYEFNICKSKLKNLTIKECTMYSLIAYGFKIGGSICDRLFTILYDKSPNKFLNCFKKTVKIPQKTGDMLKIQGIPISTYEEGHERSVS